MYRSSDRLLSLLLGALLLLSHRHRAAAAAPSLTDRFTLRGAAAPPPSDEPQEYLDPSRPPLPVLSDETPSCSVDILAHDFAYTYGLPPFSAPYSPPASCPGPWSLVLLDLSASSSGDQYDRVAAVWLDSAELLRTSTPEPTPAPGIAWRVRKDITRFSPLLRRPNATFSLMLENIVDDVFTGVYHLNLSLHFYNHNATAPAAAAHRQLPSPILGFRDSVKNTHPLPPPDEIIPICNADADAGAGYWFRIKNGSDLHNATVQIPLNTHQALLEIFVSSHGDDEFWYSNPPTSYLEKNNISSNRGNGAFREVFAMIDGRFVGSVVPFPVIFTGGINPLFWAPVVAIGAFDLPSYTLDLTPFLGLLLDGQPHNFSLGVADAIQFWLVDANLHLWLDPNVDSVEAELVQYKAAPAASVSRVNKVNQLNGTFLIEAGRKLHFSGWVNSSFGNFTTDITQKQKYKNSIAILNDGNYKEVHMKAKSKLGIAIKEGPKVVVASMSHKTKFPLLIVISSQPGENDTYTSATNLTHTLYEENTHTLGKDVTTTAQVDRQVAVGQMVVQDHSVLSGSASTEQTYLYRHSGGCHSRKVGAKDGALLYDDSTDGCKLTSS